MSDVSQCDEIDRIEAIMREADANGNVTSRDVCRAIIAYGDGRVDRLRAINAELVVHLEYMLGAIDGGSIDSEEIAGDYQAGIPPHKWHEEWASYTRAAMAKAKP